MTNDKPRGDTAELTAEPHDLLNLLASEEGGDYNTFLPSFAQQRLWFLDQLEEGNPLYNIPAVVRIGGQLNVEALESVLTEIVARHEALRTTFTTLDAHPVQLIGPPFAVRLPVEDLSTLPEAVREAEAERWLEAEARRPFDLARGPLLRAGLLRLSPVDHIFALTLHHVVSDGWSMGVLIRELVAIYEATIAGRPSPLAELDIQYADYAVWQREWLQGEVLEEQLAYWRERLAAPSVLELPTDRPRPPVQSFRGAMHQTQISATLYEALKSLSQREGVTLYMTLLAAFKVLLWRYSGQTDLIVGSPIAGRTRIETAPLIGLFVNTLALRTDLSGDPTFGELLARVREVTLGAYSHQDVPFERLVEELQPERSLSHSPLFQTMIMLKNTPMPDLMMAGLPLRRVDISTGTAKFDVTLLLEERDGGITAQWEYSTDLFEAETVARMAGHFETLLESVVAQPAQRIASLPLLTQAERQQLLVEWNDTARDYPRDLCLHQLFEAQVGRTPEAVALVCAGRQLTYAELNARADRLADHLRGLGVGPEVRVGVLLGRSPDLLVGLLGVMKAGGAYVPLDPEYPHERISFMLEDAAVPVLLTQERLRDKLPAGAARVVSLDGDWAAGAADSASAADPASIAESVAVSDFAGDTQARAALADNLAYVIYTSGSTGRPKGVSIEHRSAAAMLAWAHETFSREELAVVLASTSVCFDLSVYELFAPLTCGGRVVVAENALQLPTLAAHGATLVNTVPSAMAELLRVGGVPDSVLTVNLAGEPLKRALVEQVYERTKAGRVWNLYGPSEDTTYSTFELVPRGDASAPSIGRPVHNTQLYVLDGGMRPVPRGVVGEIYLGGAGVSRGYLGRPDATAEKYVPDPFGPTPGSRLYRTGDLARYLPDGRVDFLGRADYQVKVRGYRIELGEIESALARHGRVRACVVVAREDGGGDKRLVAYVATGDEQPPGIGELRDSLKERLPDYMIPSAFVFLNELPLTPNGKVDRKRLPAPGESRPELESRYVAPRNATEEVLAGLWAEVLRVRRVGVEDNFFELGGHSLLVTQLVARIREALQVDVPLRGMFESPTVASLARAIEQNRGQQAAGANVPKIQARRRGQQNLEHLRAKLEQMADGEVRSRLDERKPL